MAMDRAQRAARLTQLRQQLTAITEEIARLEKEDAEFGVYQDRAKAAGHTPLAYPDFARYIYAYEQLNRAWVQAGSPATGWDKLAVLQRLRDILVVPQPTPVVAAAPAAARVAAPTSNGPTKSPVPAAVEEAPAPPPPETPAEPPKPKWSQPSVPPEKLVEMHSPILNEVVDLTKRAAEEVRTIRIPDALQDLDRAVWYLERVVGNYPQLANQVLKILDPVAKSQQTMTDSDRARMESVRERAGKLVASGKP